MINKFKKIYSLSKPEITKSPIILTSPHSGRAYPEEFIKFTNFNKKQLRVFEDNYVDKLFNFNLNFDSKFLISEIPRVIVDLNRDRREIDKEMFFNFDDMITKETNKVLSGIGVFPTLLGSDPIYQKKMDWLIFKKILEDIYDLWHKVLKKELIDTKKYYDRLLLLDCHSMPSYDRSGRKVDKSFPEFVIGDLWGKSCSRDIVDLIINFLNDKGFKVARNIPYAGAFIIDNYGKPNEGINAIQLEIRKDLYFDEKKLEITNNYKKIRSIMLELIEKLNYVLHDLDHYKRSAE